MSVLKIKNENNEWESVPVINGEDGFSPTITTSKVGKETTLTITDVNGTSTATILDGEDGTGPRGMAKATYDTNDNGIVDNAEKVNNHTVLSDVPANAVFTDTTYTAGTGIAINNGVISNTQTSAEWGNITGTLSDQTDLQNALNTKANSGDIPTKLSDLNNDAGFITNTVNNLTNYYTKSNTYTKTEVDNLIGAISSLKIQVVQSLPSTDIDTSTIYLVSKTGSTGDVYNEYIYVNNAWELIGSTEVDLTNYYTKTQTDTLLSGKQASLVSGTNIKTINNESLLGSGNITIESSSGASAWGSITGTLSDQTDLNTALNSKADANSIPTKTSDLTNDSGFITSYTETDPVFNASAAKNITSSDITNWNNKSTFSGSYNDLTNKPTIPDSTSDLTNDSGFITKSVNNLDNYTTTTDLNTALANKADSSDVPKIVYLSISSSYTSSDISTLLNNGYEVRAKDGNDISMSLVYFAPNEYVRFSTTDLSGVPIIRFLTYTFGGTWSDTEESIPTYTSELINNSGFITSSVNNLTNYYTKTTIDSSLSSKQDSLVSGTNIKTINNESILGSGNITISVANVNDSYSTSTTEPYSANYVNSLNTYSTTEQVIGKWVNGKPIYRRVFSQVTLPNALYQGFAFVPNAEDIVNSWGILYDSNSRIQFPFANPSAGTFLYYYFDSLNKVFKNVQSNNWFGYKVDFFVEYTKTTD